jgi:hypothetical protein
MRCFSKWSSVLFVQDIATKPSHRDSRLVTIDDGDESHNAVVEDYLGFIQQIKSDLVLADERIAKQEIDIASYKKTLENDKRVQ